MTEKIEKPEDIFINLDDAPKNKRLSVERIYQRKTQLEHILLRPDTYVGSVEETTEQMYVFDEDKGAIIKKSVTYVPGLYKIFDEILVNAADNKQRDHRMNAVKVVIDPVQNEISVWNNGRGIPVVMHAVEKMYVPELIFGTLLTSSNYNDSQRKVTGGRNGYGAKLCNIFSSEFTVETSCSESKKSFKMTWTSNMGKSGKTVIKDSKGDFTKVTFKPDLSKFNMTHLTSDMVAIMTRRVYDLAGCTRGVAVYLNGTKIPLKTFKDYVELYVKGVSHDDDGEELPRKVVHEIVNERWEVALTASPSGFQQASFVNSIATTKGGTHVGYVVDQVVSKLLETAKKKNKGGMDLKPMHVKSHMWVFVNCLIENPSFDSQTKENMTLKTKNFGSTCSLSDKFIKGATSCGVIERVLNWARAKSQAQISKKQSGSKHSKLRGIAKLDDANEAGGKNSLDCTLIITEGDSAKSLAISGLGVIGRDNYGVFPLRGKLLNVREATHNQIMGNEEIKNLVKILGLNYSKKYEDPAELRTLRYGHLMIMADQDQDGSHIKGLVINFISHNWPRLLRHNFVEEFITPIIKVSKGQQEIAFFSLPEYERWKANTEHAHSWRTKYYKGLGTSTAKEAKEYFSDMDRHRIPFQYGGPEDDDAINLAFSKKLADRRKEWLTAWLTEKKEKRGTGMNESFLYGEQTHSITYSDFINKELILFSNADNERSIPSMVDGLKPGQRKVLYTCFKRNDKKDIKVAQLAGSVAEHSAYHHGEASLMSTIINLAQNFVGSNNLNLLQPIGQFGTRLHGGKDAASPRYIFTKLSPLARLVFPKTDDTQLKYLYDDSMRIEPEWYVPILPMVLVNGSEGIGTGYSTTVPNYDVRDIVTNLKRIMNGMEPQDMVPSYKNFTGGIHHIEPTKYFVHGNVARLSDTSIEITELPIRTWTQHYKEHVLEVMLHGSEKVQPFITDYKEYHTDTTVRFVVNMSAAKMEDAATVGLHKKFKLESSISTANMVLFDKDGCLKKYPSATDILREFYDVRLDMYQRRKDYLVGMLSAEAAKLTNQARLIMEKIEGKIVIENKKKTVLCNELKAAGYRSDPIKAWKACLARQDTEEREEEEEQEEGGAEGMVEGCDFMYLLSMHLLSLTKEKKDQLLKERDDKVEELRILQEKTPKELWKEDMDMFMEELDRLEEKERQDEQAGATISVKKSGKGVKGGKGPSRQTKLMSSSKNSLKDTKPSAFGEMVQPTIPEFNANPTKVKEKKEKKPKELPKGQTTLDTKKKKRSLEDMFGDSDEDSMAAAEMASEATGDASVEVADVSASSKNEAQATDKPAKPPPAKKAKTEVKTTKTTEGKTTKPAPKKKTAPPPKKKSFSSSDSEGSDFDVTATKKPAKKPQKRKAPDMDSDDSDFQVASAKPKPKPKRQPAKKVITLDSDGSDVELKEVKKRKPAEKKQKILVKVTSGDEATAGTSKKKAPPKKKSKKQMSSDESDWGGEDIGDSDRDDSIIGRRAPAARTMRERKRVVYAVDDDEEDEEEDDDDDYGF